MTVWLTVAEVARLLPGEPTPRHVRSLAARAERGEIPWTVRRKLKGRNSRAIEIALDESLSPEARAQHYSLVTASQPALDGTTAKPAPARRSFAQATENQRERATWRLAVVVAFERWLESWGKRKGLTLATRRWVSAYCAQHKELGTVSVTSLKRWLQEWKAAGRSIDALVDGNDGSAVRGRTSIPQQIVQEFEALYLRATKPKISTCYKQLKKVAKARGWKLPSYDSFRRHVENNILPSVAAYYREPEKRRENIRPFLQRDFDDPDFRAMQIIQSDHHQIDVAVACGDPFCSVGHYPWITVWIDVRSRKVLAVEVYVEYPNSRRILGLLHRVIVENGVPEFVYVDNGMDFVKAVGHWSLKHFDVGRRQAKIVDVAGWTPDLVERIAGPFGMEAIFSNEGNPQSKLIERWFNTLKDWLYTLYDSYRGALGERSDRAEYLRQHPDELPKLTEFAVAARRAIDEYNVSPHRGEGMNGSSPAEVFEATRPQPRREADPAALSLAFWTEKVGAKVQQQGIKFRHTWYALPPEQQVEYFGRKVNFRHDASAPQMIAVYDAAGRYLCVATARSKAPQRRGPELASSIEELQHEWKTIQALIRARNPEAAKRLAAIDAGIESYYTLLERTEAEAQPAAAAGGASAAPVVTVVDGHLSQLARQVAAARASLGDVSGLSDVQLAVAAAAEDHTEEFLAGMDRPRQAPVDDELEDPVVFAAERARLVAARELTRKRVEGECLDCQAKASIGEYCMDHYRPSE
jgi:hypothetical protein